MSVSSIPVAHFIEPAAGTREHAAIYRAEKLQTQVTFLGEHEDERYFRAQTSKHDRHVVVIWIDDLSGEPVVNCDCPSFRLKPWPEPCVHAATASNLATIAAKAGIELSVIQRMVIGDLKLEKTNEKNLL
jgi:hypothetical protein